MTVSYKWLSEYIPTPISGDELSRILTAIGLEVESTTVMGIAHQLPDTLVCGEVLSCEPHPDADKLKVTMVDTGQTEPLQIVCGAPNVARGLKVIVATIGTTLTPTNGEPFKIKKSKIRGVESFGMLCAGDEIGLNQQHDGLMLLAEDVQPGTPVKEIISDDNSDIVFEIGLTPNRSDAMSHMGVARDVCAYLTHHTQTTLRPVLPFKESIYEGACPIRVSVEDTTACRRYSGLYIQGITVKESPDWLKQKLKNIGVNSINNIVDITNYVLHATGQPLHAFDADKIKNHSIVVKKAKEGTPFVTLDGKTVQLTSNDLIIGDTESPLCIAGVYGGLNSGVSEQTVNLFLESAYFDAETIRVTSTNHQLRTEAAARFEKGSDVGITRKVLEYAAGLITEIAGGHVEGGVTDILPEKLTQRTIALTQQYVHTLSGMSYSKETTQQILTALGYTLNEQAPLQWEVTVPFFKPNVQYAADLVQEIMRIDGFDNIVIPDAIKMIPASDENEWKYSLREKASAHLCGSGFNEIFTNSIVNSNWYDSESAATLVKLINSLSTELDTLRPDMLQSGLQVVAYNINRKNSDIRFFELGKTYQKHHEQYWEEPVLALYMAGDTAADWQHPAKPVDFFTLKGEVTALLQTLGLSAQYKTTEHPLYRMASEISMHKKQCGIVAEVHPDWLKKAGIKVPVYFATLNWNKIESMYSNKIKFKEISKFPAVERDLAIVVDLSVTYHEIVQATKKAQISKMENMELFDVFESEKLGAGKKSMAMKYLFVDETKTLTDEEIDGMMQKLTDTYEKNLNAEVRK